MVHPARKSSNSNNGALVLYLRICKPITNCKSLKLHHSCMDPPPGNLQNVATVCQSRIDANPMHSNIKRIESVVGQFDHARGLKRSATSWWFLLKPISVPNIWSSILKQRISLPFQVVHLKLLVLTRHVDPLLSCSSAWGD